MLIFLNKIYLEAQLWVFLRVAHIGIEGFKVINFICMQIDFLFQLHPSFRKNHSVETALYKIYTDVLQNKCKES